MAVSGQQKVDPERLRKLLDDGLSTKAIAIAFGVKPPAITRSCHTFGLPLPQGRVPKAGKNKAWTREEDERDLKILRMTRNGWPQQDLARRLRVSVTTIKNVLTAIEAADLKESGEPVEDISRYYKRRKRGGWQ